MNLQIGDIIRYEQSENISFSFRVIDTATIKVGQESCEVHVVKGGNAGSKGKYSVFSRDNLLQKELKPKIFQNCNSKPNYEYELGQMVIWTLGSETLPGMVIRRTTNATGQIFYTIKDIEGNRIVKPQQSLRRVTDSSVLLNIGIYSKTRFRRKNDRIMGDIEYEDLMPLHIGSELNDAKGFKVKITNIKEYYPHFVYECQNINTGQIMEVEEGKMQISKRKGVILG